MVIIEKDIFGSWDIQEINIVLLCYIISITI